MDSLNHQQLTLLFYLGSASASDDSQHDAQYGAHRKAYDLIDAGVSKVPGWFKITDDNGFPAETGLQVELVTLCDFDVEVTEVRGKWAYGVTFHSEGNRIPQALAQALKDFCLQKYREAAGDLPVEFAGARQYNEWRRTETLAWPEPL